MKRSAFVIALMLGALTGCAEFDLKKNIPWGTGEDGRLERPMKLVANWSEVVMTNGNVSPTRGFGGRLVYYAKEGGKPVKVSGTLTVYAFNESDGLKDDVVPDRKFVFTEEQFAQHYSDKGLLKHSYNFWLPWDELGGEKKEISLLCRFVSSQGDVVLSEQTRHVLPGKPPTNPAVPATLAADHPALRPAAPPVGQGNRQVGYFDDIPAPAETPGRMNTTTIHLNGPSAGPAPQAHVIDVRGLEEGGVDPLYGLPESNDIQQFLDRDVIPARNSASRSAATQQPSIHSGLEKSRAPRASTAPPERGRGLWQRPRGGWQSDRATVRSAGRATAGGSNPGALFPPRN